MEQAAWSPCRANLFTCGEARRSTCPLWPPSSPPGNKVIFQEQDDEIDIGTYEIEVTEFKSQVRIDL